MCIVYDASSKEDKNVPSVSDCLHTGLALQPLQVISYLESFDETWCTTWVYQISVSKNRNIRRRSWCTIPTLGKRLRIDGNNQSAIGITTCRLCCKLFQATLDKNLEFYMKESGKHQDH